MAMKEASKNVFLFLKDNDGADLTLNDISTSLDMAVRSVNGCLVGMQKKGLVVREENQVMDSNGKTVTVKYIRLTEAADSFDPDAE